ncbi:MAG: hypothetical protein HRU38_17260 [Saccharospirillaceae bacterium]|nr:hypothetical protein [Pseudomonadales bacterium]NRB80387.1 hypothetical protein [Saccharospirillaceae bacterium]
MQTKTFSIVIFSIFVFVIGFIYWFKPENTVLQYSDGLIVDSVVSPIDAHIDNLTTSNFQGNIDVNDSTLLLADNKKSVEIIEPDTSTSTSTSNSNSTSKKSKFTKKSNEQIEAAKALLKAKKSELPTSEKSLKKSRGLEFYEIDHEFTKNELIMLLNGDWFRPPSYLENENTIIEHYWQGTQLHINTFYDGDEYSTMIDKQWFEEDIVESEYDYFVEGGIDYDLAVDPDEQYRNVYVSYHENDGWYVSRQDSFDYQRLTFNPTFNFKDEILKKCVSGLLNLKNGTIPTVGQMRSLLVIACNNVKDLSGLETWGHLRGLQLNIDTTVDLSVLKTMNTFMLLKLTGNGGVTINIKDIKDLSFLNILVIEDLKVVGEKFLSEMNNLHALFIDNNNIKNFDFLSGLNNLRTIDIRNNQLIDEYKPIVLPSTIFSIKLKNVALTNLDFLGGIQQLYSLDVSDNNIKNLSNNSYPFNLYTLNLSGNKLSDVSGLSAFSSVTKLDISNNNISDISLLSELDKLETVDASNNVIHTLPDLDRMYYLKLLRISNNAQVDCELLKNIKPNNLSLKCY